MNRMVFKAPLNCHASSFQEIGYKWVCLSSVSQNADSFMGDKGGGVSITSESLSPEQRADELLSQFKPCVVEMIKRYEASNRAVRFDDIEADAARRGDLLARELMLCMLKQQGRATPGEVERVRAEVAEVCPGLNMTRIPDKPRTLKTVRGEIEYKREYLHFPQAGKGVFPPG